MLRLVGGQTETLWDEALPLEVRELPDDLAALDAVLCDLELLAPITAHWQAEFEATGRAVLTAGRPTIAMETYVRMMVLKARYGWGYRTLVANVSDSLHLRRFCRLALTDRAPDESTVRKLTRRLGDATVAEITRELIVKATRETRFRARAVRVDSTVIEADIRYPTDAGLAAHGVRALARQGGKVAQKAREKKTRVRDRSRAMGRRLRAVSQTMRRRTGQAKTEVLELTRQTGELLEASVAEARKLAAIARRRARGRGAQAKLRLIAELEQLADRSQRVAEQITKRVAGEPIKDRLVSLSDPDARPIRKGKLGKPNEFGYVAQIAEVTPNTRRGARGFVLPPSGTPGNPGEDSLLPATITELTRLGLSVREVALDGGFNVGPTTDALTALPDEPERVFITGRQQPGSRRTQRRMQRYRTGAEGRISHLKRGYGLRRSRLKGDEGQRTWTAWATLAYDLDTYTIYA
jgi:IS5 family transposase